MIKVKICGLRRSIDIDYVNELKPDYVGFVFAESIRKVSLREAKELVKHLNKDIKIVGVFVNEDKDKVKAIAAAVGLDILQFHGCEDNEYISDFKGYEIWKSVRVKSQEDLKDIFKYTVDGVLLDSKIEGVVGGSGMSFDWTVTDSLELINKQILAGGLSIENVQRAIEIVKPYAVDVSSGVEINGFKDYNKIKEFIRKVREL